MTSILVGVPPPRFRLPHKVGGPMHAVRPPKSAVPPTPAQKRRRHEAAYLERFFAREQRRLATGLLRPEEREQIHIPSRGRITPQLAAALGLIPNPSAKEGDPEATYWILPAAHGRALYSPFLPRPRAPNIRWPNLVRPLLSPLKYRRLWFAARRQGLDHLLPMGPKGLAEQFLEREQKRIAAEGSDSRLLELAAKHWRDATPAVKQRNTQATDEEVDAVMRRFAITLPKYRHVSSPARLFPYARARLALKQKKAKAIAEAMAKMPAKVAEYRAAMRATKAQSKRTSPL